jgi:hypothetical protein
MSDRHMLIPAHQAISYGETVRPAPCCGSQVKVVMTTVVVYTGSCGAILTWKGHVMWSRRRKLQINYSEYGP